MSSYAQPLQNRVTPLGEVVAIPQRGSLMGNRGCLHDNDGIIRYRWKGKRWITCALEYKDNKVPLRAPGRYTPLFFKDEVSALAAGHRPCSQCRRPAYRAFMAAVEMVRGLNPGSLRADQIDAELHSERMAKRTEGKLDSGQISRLPDGAIIVSSGSLWVKDGRKLSLWRWGRPLARIDGGPFVLTPALALAALAGGYLPDTSGTH
tara:strand:- start:10616 stop:11233 length:618 start_codon:yes stop_codon:yes gene_type:complete